MTRAEAEKAEEKRLRKIYSNLPPKQMAIADGLIVQAARLRANLDELNADIAEHGLTEMFSLTEKREPAERERPAAQLFTKMDKNYQAIIDKLNDMIIDDAPVVDELTEFLVKK